jgi:hypothetical protein
MARKLSKKRPGEPSVVMRSQKFGALRQFNNPVVKKRSIRTLIKVQESKGTSIAKDVRPITSAKGVDTGRGFASSARIVLQRPFVKPPFSTRPGKIIPPLPKVNSQIRHRKQGP